MTSKVLLLCMATWGFCASFGWLIADVRGMVVGIAIASFWIGLAQVIDK